MQSRRNKAAFPCRAETDRHKKPLAVFFAVFQIPHGGNMAVIKFCLTTGNTEIPLKANTSPQDGA
ncbi:hypothetical protein NEIPOLOT_02530 [Neisseria polysaccharea ATCC 43768]|nr:hypothetical protein NEIPOLOT_02530 [Neisseria polysaccharea ATCC 43768]